ncbi:MAG TPA: hypothetical protein VL863_08860 [bacterium]|nr:hypothetical protein [bacterium]
MNRPVLLLLTLLLWSGALKLSAQGTAFNYQGRLSDAGIPANGKYDLRFAVFNAVTNGSQAGSSVTNFNVAVSNGLFAATLDFGSGLFTGTNYWLDIAVRATNVTTVFTMLVPRQPILPVPYAIFANSASNVIGSVSSTQLTGTVPSAQITGTYSGVVNFANGANTFAGTFIGTGSAVSNLNASQLTSGTVADARLTPNVALLDRGQTFSGANNLTNWGNNFVGSFFGNGLVGWTNTSAQSVQAERDHGYMLTGLQFITLTMPAAPAPVDIVRISGAGTGGWRALANAGQSFIGNFIGYRNSLMQLGQVGSDWRSLASSADGTRMYAGGNFSGGVYLSTDSGHTWASSGIGSVAGWFSVACSDDGNKAYAAPNGGKIQASADGGATWVPFGTSANWTAIACSADATKYVAGASSGGLTGNINSSPASGNWTAVTCSSDGTNIAAAIGAQVYTTTNAGANWTTCPSLSGNCSALVAAASGPKLVAAYNGGIVISTNFGLNWSPTGAGALAWSSLAGSSDCTRLVAGVSNGLFYASANFGASWTALTTTNQFWSGATVSANGTVFAGCVRSIGSFNGSIFYSDAITQTGTIATNSIVGSQGTTVELQYIGNGQFMPVSSVGTIWAN